MELNNIIGRINKEINEDTKYTTIDGQKPHKHKYEIDRDGNGKTTITIGRGLEHTHKIKNYEVKPAGHDNHAHKIEEK
jgi:hypothetical protein